ncbi:MAG: PQQ-binding-like beta-propeller repeat protein [Phycisphaerae bacterium]|nr:PQQ-binding-like beta-propeller repeat protein [Phycisphaerae bacterium]
MKKSPQLRVFVFACLVAATVSTSGCSWLLGDIAVSPPSRQPIVYDDHVVFNSLTDSKTLTCIDLRGRKIWEREYPSDIRYSRKDDSSVAVQVGMDMTVVDVPTGSETPLFKTRAEHELVRFDRNGTVLYVEDNRWEHRQFRMLDPESGDVLWEKAEFGHVILVLENMLICVTGVEPAMLGAAFELDGAVEAFDLKSGKRVWRIPFSENLFLFGRFPVAYLHPYIVIPDGLNKLMCIRVDNGQIVSTIDMPETDELAMFINLGSTDGLLVYTKNGFSRQIDDGRLEFVPPLLRLYSLPDLKEESVTELSAATGMLTVMCYDQYIIALVCDPTFGMACFNVKTGQKTWEKQLPNGGDWSEPASGKIYFTDRGNSKDIPFRVGVIDIPSGNETIIYEEEISDDDSGS